MDSESLRASLVTEAVAQEGPVPKKTLAISPDLKLPLDAVTQTFAILAMRGVGKTYTASVMAEEFCEAGLPFAVLDPTGAWYGLRSSADGKSDGYPVTILGGDHADAPLEETGGKVIADLLAEEAPPLILDMSRLSKSAMRRFVADFAERLYEKNRNPLHLIIDEADAFAPQKARPDELRMLGAIDEIVRRGRIRGLGCTLVTQRSAVLNKDVLTQTEVLVALRTAHPRDRAPVLEWMKVHATEEQLAEVEESLAKLPKGDAWVMSAGWLELFERIHVRERRTFNSSATPEPGQRHVTARKLATVDLAVLQKRMAETIEKAKATDPKLLQARVRELEKQVAAKVPPPPAPAPAKEKRVEVPVLKGAELTRLEKVAGRLDAMFNRFADAQLTVHKTWSEIKEAMEDRGFRAPSPPPRPLPIRPAPPAHVPARPRLPRASNSADADASVGNSGLRRMLIALAQRPQGLTNRQLGIRAGVSSRSGTFSTYLSKARSHGWIVGRGALKITDAGLAALGPYDPLPEGSALAEYWLRELGESGASRILRALLAVYPAALDAQTLGEQANISHRSGTFSTYLSRLRGLELVEGRGELRASEELVG